MRSISIALSIFLCWEAKLYASQVRRLVCLIPPPELLSIWGPLPMKRDEGQNSRLLRFVFRGLESRHPTVESSDAQKRKLVLVRGGESWEGFHIYNYNLRENFEYFSRRKEIVLTHIFRDFGSMASYYQSTGMCDYETDVKSDL